MSVTSTSIPVIVRKSLGWSIALSVLIILAVRLRPMAGSGWLFVDSIVTLVLAIIIYRTWPANAGWVLGILVGFSMLFSGLSRLMLSLAARRLVSETP